MANYSKSTNFAVKDSLTTGDPNKIVSGTEIDTEFNSLASMSSTKADKVGGATAGNLATLTASGGIQDSGSAVSDLYNTDNLKTDLDATGDAPIYAARAWVSYVSDVIESSKNVNSVTKIKDGEYVVNLDEPMESENYCIVVSPFGQGSDEFAAVQASTTSTFTVYGYKVNEAFSDISFSAVVFS